MNTENNENEGTEEINEIEEIKIDDDFQGPTIPVEPNGGGNINLPPVPNAVAVLVLGILSIVTCACYGFPGVILGIIALVLAKKGKKAYDLNPEAYSPSSLSNLNGGKICAIIGLIVSSLHALVYVFYIILFIIALIAGSGAAFEGPSYYDF